MPMTSKQRNAYYDEKWAKIAVEQALGEVCVCANELRCLVRDMALEGRIKQDYGVNDLMWVITDMLYEMPELIRRVKNKYLKGGE